MVGGVLAPTLLIDLKNLNHEVWFLAWVITLIETKGVKSTL